MHKNCLRCKITIFKTDKWSKTQWKNKKYCSRNCKSISERKTSRRIDAKKFIAWRTSADYARYSKMTHIQARCQCCGKTYTKTSPAQKYCGSPKKLKFGCAYIIRLEQSYKEVKRLRGEIIAEPTKPIEIPPPVRAELKIGDRVKVVKHWMAYKDNVGKFGVIEAPSSLGALCWQIVLEDKCTDSVHKKDLVLA